MTSPVSELRAGRSWLIYALLLVGMIARLVPHPWNASPVIAIALFGGALLPKRWSIVLPVLVLAATDLILLWHATVPFTWGATALIALLGWSLRARASAWRIALASVSGSVLFFVITNFGVWTMQTLYPKTVDGLWQCYIAGLPFFRTSVIGDLLFSAVFFGGYALASRAPSLQPRTSTVK